jgi:zinc protease
VGRYGRAIDTSAGMAAVLTSDALYGVDLAAVGRYTQDVEAIDAAEAQAAAHLAIDPAAASLILVGDAKAFIRPLRERFPDAQVVEASSLDLGSATLRLGK